MDPDPVRVANAAAWLRKASQDLFRVDRCMTAESPDLEDALFHCQQAAEKALKAFLSWHDVPFRKTHDLAVLGTQCGGIDGTLNQFVARLDDLTEYAWVYRYPISLQDPLPADAIEAARVARDIVSEIRQRLPCEVRDAAGGDLKSSHH